MEQQLLTVAQAAQQLGCGRTTIYALIKSGELASVRIGRLRRIPVQVVTDWINHQLAREGRGHAPIPRRK